MKARLASALALAAGIFLLLAAITWTPAEAGQPPRTYGYRALDPITQGNLTIFPVVAASTHDTRDFLTLDEGLRSGQVEVTEAGRVRPLVRRGGTQFAPEGAQVNTLVLVNHSGRPLILLAGEIVTGGKQDRVVGKDRIIPAHSDPVALGVFCVEPGRWTARSGGGAKFDSLNAQMAQPSVRKRAMSDKDQQQVWNEVHKSAEAMAAGVPAAAGDLAATSSYAQLVDNEEVKRHVDSVAVPLERSYEGLMRELRARNAVGVVAAVNGEIIWADLFASPQLLEKYWPKLVRSYAAEALTTRPERGRPTVAAAQAFLDDLSGTREVVESEPGVFRHTEVVGRGFRVFELASLLPKTGFDVHISKVTE
ncbi:MAG: ARPP-1 family domain-containing protein [Terriglobales bacterium]